MFGAICCFILFACNNKPAETTSSTDADSTGKMKQPQQSEFDDQKYAEIGKTRLRQMESGDIDAWLSSFADKKIISNIN